MNNKLKFGILIFLALLTVFDGFTTFWGTQTILGVSPFSSIISGIFALGIGAMLLSTASIFEYAKYHNGFAKILPLIWFIFFVYDVFTSWVGNLNLMYGENINLTGEQFAILAPVTIFVSISAIVISFVIKD
jgi:hypothetical protein